MSSTRWSDETKAAHTNLMRYETQAQIDNSNGCWQRICCVTKTARSITRCRRTHLHRRHQHIWMKFHNTHYAIYCFHPHAKKNYLIKVSCCLCLSLNFPFFLFVFSFVAVCLRFPRFSHLSCQSVNNARVGRGELQTIQWNNCDVYATRKIIGGEHELKEGICWSRLRYAKMCIWIIVMVVIPMGKRNGDLANSAKIQ